jgi:hypothetical protein
MYIVCNAILHAGGGPGFSERASEHRCCISGQLLVEIFLLISYFLQRGPYVRGPPLKYIPLNLKKILLPPASPFSIKQP